MEYTTWDIEGLSLELDITDADAAERYDAAAELLRKDIPATGKVGMNTVAYIRTYCMAHRKFYDTVFGEPVSERIFAKIPDSIRKYNAIYAKFLAFIAGQSTAVRNETTEICEKYLPKGGKK